VQTTLWAAAEPAAPCTFDSLKCMEHVALSHGAWVEVKRSWIRGGFGLFDDLVASPQWRAEQRRMYDTVVDVPRLLRFFGTGDTVPWPELVQAGNRLSAHYQPVLGEDFTSTGLCLYRDGRDSVAWHGDTLGRAATHDTIVAVLSLGAARTFALRPKGGGQAIRTWDHAIPKTARPVGPRVSVQFRPDGVS
jgi:alkylated DNA repair dioxygenase AlkB